ncbi:MAG TPA: DUF2277 family protein [Acidimicrobiales bacterium]|nr:DUF2277 family protein [Acidimicrobiales bacterium]
MCRNITPLRGLEPPATADEIESAARQYVRKVSAASTPAVLRSPAFERAVAQVAAATAALLAELPPRRRPPATVPPLRRQRRAEGSARSPAGELEERDGPSVVSESGIRLDDDPGATAVPRATEALPASRSRQ